MHVCASAVSRQRSWNNPLPQSLLLHACVLATGRFVHYGTNSQIALTDIASMVAAVILRHRTHCKRIFLPKSSHAFSNAPYVPIPRRRHFTRPWQRLARPFLYLRSYESRFWEFGDRRADWSGIFHYIRSVRTNGYHQSIQSFSQTFSPRYHFLHRRGGAECRFASPRKAYVVDCKQYDCVLHLLCCGRSLLCLVLAAVEGQTRFETVATR